MYKRQIIASGRILLNMSIHMLIRAQLMLYLHLIMRQQEMCIRDRDEILKFLSVMTGDSRYEEILSDKEGVSNMCDVCLLYTSRCV